MRNCNYFCESASVEQGAFQKQTFEFSYSGVKRFALQLLFFKSRIKHKPFGFTFGTTLCMSCRVAKICI